MAELQVIPARHGTATFVPAGQTIKIINTSGTQVIDTWAFALPKPETKEEAKAGEAKAAEEQQKPAEEKKEESNGGTKEEKSKPAQAKSKKNDMSLPSQEEAEKATEQGMQAGDDATKDSKKATPQKSTWGSYVPSIGWRKSGAKDTKQESQQQKDSKTWGSYFPSGKGFSNYIPKNASDTVSQLASEHKRDPNKSYLEQLQQFSKTPVGAAGLAAITGSGYGGSLYAGYNAYSQLAADVPPMEYMSMPHSRAATLHLRPKVNDTLVSNLREPIMTLVEDTSPGVHDTLIAACDPPRYKGLGVEEWQSHGSCAENLVLALKELNERAGLKGAKGVGADVTINAVPAPLNLFMNIPWDEEGDIGFHAPKSKANDYVRLKAERDLVVVMSACPQDVLDINNKKPTDAHFLVEGGEEPAQAVKRTANKKRPPPRKISSSHATSTVASEQPEQESAPAKKPVPQRRKVPQKKPTAEPEGGESTAQPAQSQPAKKKPAPPPVQAQKKPSTTASQATADTSANGTAAPVEKKKPRKLAPRAKPEAPKAEA